VQQCKAALTVDGYGFFQMGKTLMYSIVAQITDSRFNELLMYKEDVRSFEQYQ